MLLLIVSEATQEALIGGDRSVTNAVLVILTLLALEIGLSFLTLRLRPLDKLIDSVPLVLVDHGRTLDERMQRSRVTRDDVLSAAREQGIERLEQVKYAVLERNGQISVLPVNARNE